MRTIIVAYDEDRAIGRDGTIPWRLPEDFKHFKETTMGCPCIMGRKTWDSLPPNFKPLPGRPNLIVTRNCKEVGEQILYEYKPGTLNFPKVAPNLESAIEFCEWMWPNKEIFIIGGAQIYQCALENKFVNRVLATEVKGRHEGDTFFPDLPLVGIELAKSYRLVQEFKDFNIVEYVL